MDGSLISRKSMLLAKLAARTDHRGRPKPNYTENVAAIRAELAMMEEKQSGSTADY